jgi:two-component system, cell cycle response regulator DivK
MSSIPTNRLVLIAEDSNSTRFMLRCCLETEGYEVVEATNGLEFVELALKASPNVILVDIDLPKLNGLSALRRIRKHEKMRSIPAIAITGHTQAKLRASAFSAGCCAYMTKPFKIEEIVELIEEFVSTAANKHELAQAVS